MTMRSGTTVRCNFTRDGQDCFMSLEASSKDEALELLEKLDWVTDGDRHFCPHCADVRSSRKSPGEIAPDGVRVMEVFDAAEAAGFEREDLEEGRARFECCGEKVRVYSMLGAPYRAECEKCGTAIADILGPSGGNSWIAFPDHEKVDIDDPKSWIIVSEYEEERT